MRTVGFDTSLYILSPIIGFVSDETIRVERRPDGGAVPRWSLGSAKMRGSFISDLAVFGGRVGLRCPAVAC